MKSIPNSIKSAVALSPRHRSVSLLLTLFATSAPSGAQTLLIDVLADGRVQSSGVLGETLFTDEERIITSRSGGSNISNGLFEFDLALVPAGVTITGVDLLIRTSGTVSQVGSNPAPVIFSAFRGNGMLELLDNSAPATEVVNQNFQGTVNNTDLDLSFTTVTPVQDLLDDADSTDFLTIRSETVNFVTFQVDSLESTATDAVAASLRITYVPEPSSAFLCLLGGAAMAVRRRR